MATGPTTIEWLQLAAPFVAAGIGVLAYGKQKRADRMEQIHSEKREIYKLFVTQMNSYLVACINFHLKPDGKDPKSKVNDAYYATADATTSMLLYSSDSVAKSSKSYLSATREFQFVIFDEKLKTESKGEWREKRKMAFSNAKNQRNKMISVMRSDLLETPLPEAESIVSSFFPNHDVEDQNK